MKVSDFDFYLPDELIAQHPVEPRDASRLMIVNKDNGIIEHKHFRDLPQLLRPGDVLILNNTRVIPARLMGEKAAVQAGSGTQASSSASARLEVLLLKRLERDVWEVLVKPGKRLHTGQRVSFGGGLLTGELLDILDNGNRLMRFVYDGVFEEILDRLGQMPLPPYITAELSDPERYQTVYAKERGSAAAPTAGLHFTPELLSQLRANGVEILEILLHVGLGTFRPVKVENIQEHVMHSEYYRVNQGIADRIKEAKRNNQRVIAVGTTVARTLESISGADGGVRAGEGWTDIFIYPGYRFKTVDALITNFHFPKSTLIMLVSAFAGRDLILNAYQTAVEKKYRFYSFGDAMLII